MKKMNKLRLIWLIALILFVVGLLFSLQTLRQLKNTDKKLKEKISDISLMQGFTRDLSVYIKAKEAYQKITGASPIRFESLFDASGLIAKENVRASEVQLDDDWFVLRREVVIDDGELEAVITFIKKAEAQHPPWKLSSCDIKSSTVAPGHGRMVLLFEALEQR